VGNSAPTAYAGIAHTRWATHGAPTHINAHPHLSFNEEIVLVHNGIIENYEHLKRRLTEKGIPFLSETDTEVLCNWIAYVEAENPRSLLAGGPPKGFSRSRRHLWHSHSSPKSPQEVTLVRRFSPIVIGFLPQGYMAASDATPLVAHTREVLHLEDDEFAILNPTLAEPEIHTFTARQRLRKIEYIDWDISEIEKEGYPHYMLKEIFEQPRSIQDCMRGRIRKEPEEVRLGGIASVLERLLTAPRMIITACGTSYHAGLVGKYLLEHLARLPVEVEYASEFRYRDMVLGPNDVVLGISQSGETADTLAALRQARERGALVLGITNVVGSSIPRITDAGVYIHAGPEIGVASTKAFTGQLTALTLLALHLGAARYKIDRHLHDTLIHALLKSPPS
jgi:glucosamine--fructose-6-phosphate aminotransferase (isomerizing)